MRSTEASPAEIEAFREELESNMGFLGANYKNLSPSSRVWVERMVDFYTTHDRMTDKQISIVLPSFRELKHSNRS